MSVATAWWPSRMWSKGVEVSSRLNDRMESNKRSASQPKEWTASTESREIVVFLGIGRRVSAFVTGFIESVAG